MPAFDSSGGIGASAFPPIADYAFLSDCETCALVAPSGNVEWMCLPRPDGPSVFGAMLDRAAGGFRLGPESTMIPAGRRYVPGTNVHETTWQTPTGWLLVHDFLSMGPWYHVDHRSNDHRRAPDDCYDDPDALRRWGTLALAAGVRAAAAKRPRSPRPRAASSTKR